jgi:cytoplasmic tRNA 2-thiolation protein 1
MAKLCELCSAEKALVRRPKTGQSVCRSCFYRVFEEEVHQTIISSNLFSPGEKVALAVSGGKGPSAEHL